MKILVIGLGSIGQRHLSNLKKIFKKTSFYALRKIGKKIIIKETRIIKKSDPIKYFNIGRLNSYKEAKKLKPNIVFICNPSVFHYRDAKFFASIGSHLFIEKPLIANIPQIKKISNILSKKGSVSMIGYNMRFHPIISFLKKIYKNKKYGKLISANFKFFTYLPSHHPYENYKIGYAAKKKLGGGVLNSLIHEVDLIAYFFGLPNELFVNKFNSKILDIDVEDNLSSIMIYKNFKQKFYINLNLSMASSEEERKVNFVYSNFTIECNLIKNIIKIINHKSKKIIFEKKFTVKRNMLFLNELKYFKKSILKTKQNFLSIKNNLDTIKLYNMIKNFKN